MLIIDDHIVVATDYLKSAVDSEDYAMAAYWQARIEALEDVLTEIEALEHKPVHLEVVK